MANLGFDLPENSYLATNDYLVSPSGTCYVIQQGDGNLVVYRGAFPDEAGGSIWASGQHPPNGSFFLIMQGDGNLVMYPGTYHPSPPPLEGAVWASNSERAASVHNYHFFVSDEGQLGISDLNLSRTAFWGTPNTDKVINFGIQSISYDTSNATVGSSVVQSVDGGTYTNNLDQQQTFEVDGSYEADDSSGWSDALEFKVGVSAGIGVDVPLFANGTVTVSAEVSNTYTWNGSVTYKNTISWRMPAVVPAHSTVKATAVFSQTAITVPYTLRVIQAAALLCEVYFRRRVSPQ